MNALQTVKGKHRFNCLEHIWKDLWLKLPKFNLYICNEIFWMILTLLAFCPVNVFVNLYWFLRYMTINYFVAFCDILSHGSLVYWLTGETQSLYYLPWGSFTPSFVESDLVVSFPIIISLIDKKAIYKTKSSTRWSLNHPFVNLWTPSLVGWPLWNILFHRWRRKFS